MNVELRPVDSVRPFPGNARQNDAAVDAVARSIQEFGFRQPIVVDEQLVFIVGHTRFKAAIKLGMAAVPVHIAIGLSPEQVRAYRIADNQSANLADWDYELLPIELIGLMEANYDLSFLGFDPDELANLLGPTGNEGSVDPDDVPAAPDEAITQPGDVWVLGDHRLLCGDSTQPDEVARLMAGQSARMVFTDPPWNVGIGQDSNPRHRQRPGLQNDDLPAADFRDFLGGFVQSIQPHFDGDLYCVLGASEWPTLDSALREHGYHWSATVIWVKDVFVLAGPSTTAGTSRSGTAGTAAANPRSAPTATSTTCGRSGARGDRRSIQR
jgi:hypothetical protein